MVRRYCARRRAGSVRRCRCPRRPRTLPAESRATDLLLRRTDRPRSRTVCRSPLRFSAGSPRRLFGRLLCRAAPYRSAAFPRLGGAPCLEPITGIESRVRMLRGAGLARVRRGVHLGYSPGSRGSPSCRVSRSSPIIAPTATPSISRRCFARSRCMTWCDGLWLSGRNSTWRSSWR